MVPLHHLCLVPTGVYLQEVSAQCYIFLATLAGKLSVVRGQGVNLVMEWLRAKLSFEVLRSALLCVITVCSSVSVRLRGSKKARYKNDEVKIDSIQFRMLQLMRKMKANVMRNAMKQNKKIYFIVLSVYCLIINKFYTS